MHRLLLGLDLTDAAVHVDHASGDRLDNRRVNLRPCTHAENQRNQGPSSRNASGYKGVSLYKRDGTYRASIAAHGRRRHLGYYSNPVEAARAYDAAARELHGEFARTNFRD